MHPPLFKGAIEPKIAEDWLLKVEKIFDGMRCPEDRKVSLAVFTFEGEAQHWWVGQQQEKFQGRLTSMISWKEFVKVFEDWFVPPSARQQMQESFMRLVQGGKTVMQYEAEFTSLARYSPQLVSTPEEKCYRFLRGLKDILRQPLIPFRIIEFAELVERARLIENDMAMVQRRWEAGKKRFDGGFSKSNFSGKKTRFNPEEFGKTNIPIMSNIELCVTCGKRHSGKCFKLTGQCFKCGQLGHKVMNCPQANSWKPNTFPPKSYGESSINRGGGRTTVAKPIISQGEQASFKPAPVQGRVYALTQQESNNAPDVVIGTTLISTCLGKILFDTGASHSFISEKFFAKLCVPRIALYTSLSIMLPTRDYMIASYTCICDIEMNSRRLESELIILPLTEFDVILGMNWLSKYNARIDCGKKKVTLFLENSEKICFFGDRSVLFSLLSAFQIDKLWKKGNMAFLAYVKDGSMLIRELDIVPMVKEFIDVFPDELVSLPPEHEVEFFIELAPDT